MRYRRRLKSILLKFLRIRGTPYKVAFGFAIGSSINFIPSFGFAIPAAVFFAGILRINIVAAVLGDIIFKPVFPIFFYLNLLVGNLFLGKHVHHLGREVRALMHLNIASLKVIGSAFFLGMTVNIIAFAVVIYLIVFTIFKYFRIPLLHMLRDSKFLKVK